MKGTPKNLVMAGRRLMDEIVGVERELPSLYPTYFPMHGPSLFSGTTDKDVLFIGKGKAGWQYALGVTRR
ncbi:MAG: hypothetical protein KDA84_06005 [Planctomycetaceae bacterium]|nr:hypothetical protein [Planctomycetaceae bacterium]